MALATGVAVVPLAAFATPSRPATTGLPLGFATHDARQVVTVTVPSAHSTSATLQAWTKARNGNWVHYRQPVPAFVAGGGVRRNPMEGQTYTPVGSFTLTQAFGHHPDPGSHLPYLATTPDDWWISQRGPLYNTHQRCSSGCQFRQGIPNAQLYYVQPQYNYAIVIDYNRHPVRQGHGSGFFLHVTRGVPSHGCVGTSAREMTSLLQWLRPADHPRILIGVAG